MSSNRFLVWIFKTCFLYFESKLAKTSVVLGKWCVWPLQGHAYSNDKRYSNADGTTSDPYKLSLLLDTQKGKVQKVDLLPDEIPLKDVIGQQGCDVSKISSMVRSYLKLELRSQICTQISSCQSLSIIYLDSFRRWLAQSVGFYKERARFCYSDGAFVIADIHYCTVNAPSDLFMKFSLITPNESILKSKMWHSRSDFWQGYTSPETCIGSNASVSGSNWGMSKHIKVSWDKPWTQGVDICLYIFAQNVNVWHSGMK